MKDLSFEGSTSNGEPYITKEPVEQANGDEVNAEIKVDAIIVGGGLSGISALHRFRKLNLQCKILEAGSDFGGVWLWNKYPGARTDSEVPFYQLHIPEVYKTWSFKEKFAGRDEICRYISHVDHTLNLRKDTVFNARVSNVVWNDQDKRWTIRTLQGHKAVAKYLVLATGALHRTYTPQFPGLSDFKGQIIHSGEWDEKFDAKGKKIALLGAASTAVQITQEVGKTAEELVLLIRRPSYALPIRQRQLTDEEQAHYKSYYPTLFRAARNSRFGAPITGKDCSTLDESTDERNALLDELWAAGGFNIALGGYKDVISNPDANRIYYDYWRKRVCERLTDPKKQEIMAPETPPYYFGTKRTSLEHDYYEVVNQPNVVVHDLNRNPLDTFTPAGIRMNDGTEYQVDAVILATGFDSFTGAVFNLGIKNTDGIDLKESWGSDIRTYLGLMVSGFPNVWMTYGPQAPTLAGYAPTIIEAQADIITSMIAKMEAEGLESIEPEEQAERDWVAKIDAMAEHALIRFTDSWWNNNNIPGKKTQNLIYLGGLDKYEAECMETLDGWKGFKVK